MMYGYDSPEKLVSSVTDIATQIYANPSDRAEFMHVLNTTGRVVNHECQLLRRDGSTFWASRNARVVYNTDGGIQHYQGFATDITDRKNAEARQRDSEIVQRTIMERLPIGMAIIDAESRQIEFVNTAAAGMFGADPDRIQGNRCHQFLCPATECTCPGEVTVKVTLGEERDDDCLLCFSVRDTGIGIPEEKHAMLFEKFSQADYSTTRNYGGTGLGLSISKQLAEMMGGEIGVNSREGHGAEFWFTILMGKQERCAKDMPSPALLHGVRALVVDDNMTNCEILSINMTNWGMRPFEVQEAPLALGALYQGLEENDPYHLAVIDMQMPGMDGLALGRAIRADPRLAGVAMVMLTSMGTHGDAKLFQDAGFRAYALKPIRRRDLLNILQRVLADAATEDNPQIITRQSAREQALPLHRTGRILIAEDNITNQQVAVGILTKLGMRADAVANGVEALQALRSIPYDMVLMDVQMPVMDGFEATRQVRRTHSEVLDPAIPIIAMTAHAMHGYREQCLELLGLVDLQPAVLIAPSVKRLLTNADGPARLSHCLAFGQNHFGLPQLGNDLLRSLSFPAHIPSSMAQGQTKSLAQV
jgi:PAS domain S-box-containing protein